MTRVVGKKNNKRKDVKNSNKNNIPVFNYIKIKNKKNEHIEKQVELKTETKHCDENQHNIK